MIASDTNSQALPEHQSDVDFTKPVGALGAGEGCMEHHRIQQDGLRWLTRG